MQRPVGSQYDDKTVATVRAMLIEGVAPANIATKLGIPYGTVRDWWGKWRLDEDFLAERALKDEEIAASIARVQAKAYSLIEQKLDANGAEEALTALNIVAGTATDKRLAMRNNGALTVNVGGIEALLQKAKGDSEF